MQPERLGRYEIVRELGRGAMGVVYEATDPNIGRAVALKTVRLDAISNNPNELSQRFRNEARAAGRLNHPNIVTVYDTGEQDGVLYIAMELLDGRTLQSVLAESRRLPLDQAIDITRQICAGLDFAHSKGIIHRDIKPGNIILGSHGFAKITDFGIARSGEAMTLTGQILGTPNYMSPEQVMGKTLDARSDLFSVGVILYEAVTGERPFDAQNITTVMYKIVHETPIPPRALDASIHPGLSALIEKALAKPPEMRFQSGAELAAALKDYRQLDPAQITAATLGADPDATAAYAGPPPSPSVVVGGRYETGPRAIGGAPAVPPTTPAEIPPARKTRRALYVRALPVLAGLLVVAWGLMHRANKTPQSIGPAAIAGVQNAPASPQPPEVPGQATPAQPTAAAPSKSEVAVLREAAPDKTTASLKVNSSPPAAEILVDGKGTGKTTPARVELPKGEHSITVRLQGFQPSAAKFRVRGGEELEFSPTLSVAMPAMPYIPKVAIPGIDLSGLQNLKGMNEEVAREQEGVWQAWAQSAQQGKPALIVITRPIGANIAVDGKDTGKKSPALIPLSATGTHQVKLDLDGYEPVSREVKVTEHAPAQLRVTLHPVGAPPPPQ